MLQDFCVGLCCPVFAAGIHVSVGLNCDQMEEGEQYSEYLMERNLRTYMSMRDYRNLPWQSQQPVERNQNAYRSMRDYRDQWMSAPSYMVPPQYASLSQPQPPQPISPVEQAILDLTKLVGDALEEQKKFNAQLSKKIHTVESSLNKELDEFQSEIDENFDILQQVQEELMQEPVEAPEELPIGEAGGGRGKEAGEEHQRLILHSILINLDPSAIAQPKDSPLPAASSQNPVYTLPAALFTPAAHSESKAPKATPLLPALQNVKKLVATVQAFTTTLKKMAASDVA